MVTPSESSSDKIQKLNKNVKSTIENCQTFIAELNEHLAQDPDEFYIAMQYLKLQAGKMTDSFVRGRKINLEDEKAYTDIARQYAGSSVSTKQVLSQA